MIQQCQIDNLREELNNLISSGASFQEIYDISIALDEFIVAFYLEVVLKK